MLLFFKFKKYGAFNLINIILIYIYNYKLKEYHIYTPFIVSILQLITYIYLLQCNDELYDYEYHLFFQVFVRIYNCCVLYFYISTILFLFNQLFFISYTDTTILLLMCMIDLYKQDLHNIINLLFNIQINIQDNIQDNIFI